MVESVKISCVIIDLNMKHILQYGIMFISTDVHNSTKPSNACIYIMIKKYSCHRIVTNSYITQLNTE